MNIKKQLLLTVLIVASGSLWAMDENDPHRRGVFSDDTELSVFDHFVKNCNTLTIDVVKEIRKEYPHFYSWATPDGKTPLHFLVRWQNIEVLKFMLHDGADPHLTTDGGENVFKVAKRTNKKMYQALFEFQHQEFFASIKKEDHEASQDESSFSGTSVLSFAAGAFMMYLAKTTFDKYYSDKK